MGAGELARAERQWLEAYRQAEIAREKAMAEQQRATAREKGKLLPLREEAPQ
jgi:hypothetical protein